jgi:suppressor of ftsI
LKTRTRTALISAALLAAALGVVTTVPRLTSAQGQEIQNPPQLYSSNGALNVTLAAAVNPATGLPALQYNGVIGPMGPTLHINPGDTLNVNYSNHLPVTGANGMCSSANVANGIDYMDDTNLHYHGMKVSPNPPADQVITTLLSPGQSYAYSVPIPVDDAPGLYWYHAHPHCESNRQVTGGVNGTLVVQGIEKYYPQVASMPERVLVIQNQYPAGVVVVSAKQRAARNKQLHALGVARAAVNARTPAGLRRTAQSSSTNPDCTAPAAYNVTLNGQPVDAPATPPQITIGPGQKQFWRVANEGSNVAVDIALVGPNGQLAPFQVIARDGQPLSYHDPTNEYLEVTDYVLMPAARVELIVSGPGGPGWTLQTLCVDTGPVGDPDPQRVLATINSQTYNGPPLVPANDNIPPLQKPQFNILTYPIAQYRTVVFSEDAVGDFYINGQEFNPNAPPMFTPKLGTVEQWTIINTATEIHAFHVHQIHFLVQSVGGVADGPAQDYRDTIELPISNGQANSNVVKVLMDFTDPIIVGTFVFHCHLLEHEDGGMMAKIQVVQ